MAIKATDSFHFRDNEAGYDVLIQDWECDVCGHTGTDELLNHIAGPGFVGTQICPKCPEPQWVSFGDFHDFEKKARKSAMKNAKAALAKKRLVAAQEAQKGQDD